MPTICHLKRVPQLPPRNSKHPLAGLWVADYGPQGMEVLQLHYNFRGKAASLHATKITGDESVPAGQCSWYCVAAALPIPWGAIEQQVVQQQEERWLQEREWWDEEDEGEYSVGGSSIASTSAAPAVAAAAAAALSEPPPAAGSGPAIRSPSCIVAIQEGSGQVAGPGFQNPEWVAGQLLVLADGRLSFAWLEGLEQVTEMRRLRMPM